MSEVALSRAKEGVLPLASRQENPRNYLDAGGKASLADFDTARYDHAIEKINILLVDDNEASLLALESALLPLRQNHEGGRPWTPHPRASCS